MIGTGAYSVGATGSGREDFLRLLVAQLQNQDPLSPLEPHEFASQLAGFTSVEQLMTLNDGLAQQTQSIQLSTLLSETAFSASLLGRHVLAEGNQVTIPGDGSGAIHVEIGGGGGRAELRLLDLGGAEVARRDLGPVAGGRATLDLPDDLPPGTYRYALVVTGADGESVPVTTFTTGAVDGVRFLSDRVLLRLGDLEVQLSDIVEVWTASGQAPGRSDS